MWDYISCTINLPAILVGWYVASSSSFSPPTCLARETLPLASYHQYSLVDHWSKQAPPPLQVLLNPRWNSRTFSIFILCTSKHYSKKGPECFTRLSKGSMAPKKIKNLHGLDRLRNRLHKYSISLVQHQMLFFPQINPDSIYFPVLENCK